MATITFTHLNLDNAIPVTDTVDEVLIPTTVWTVDSGVDPFLTIGGEYSISTPNSSGSDDPTSFTGRYDGTESGDPVFFITDISADAFGSLDDGDNLIMSASDRTGDSTDPDSFVDFPVCFAAGTLISTPDGECAVEDLQIGDLVLTAEGKEVPVLWIGLQKVHKIFTPPERFVPVRVKAGALGVGLPHSDLVLTADHALVMDGVAVNASAMVNGTTITYDPIESLPDMVTYYHVETEAHEVILANGTPAETYVDYIQRRAFSNYSEYVELYGEERVIQEMDMPRVSSARLPPPSIRERITGSAAA